MNIGNVWQALNTRATSDTGTGGLFAVSNPLITGWFSEQGPQAATYPYVVVNISDDGETDTFGSSGRELAFNVNIYVSRDAATSINALERANAIAARVFGNGNPNSPTYGFHRWQTVLPMGSGMVATTCARTGGTSASDRDTVHLIETYTLSVYQE